MAELPVTTCFLYVDGKAPRRLPNGRVFPGRRARVFLLRVSAVTCDCGRPMGFTKETRGKNRDYLKRKEWKFACSCGKIRWLPRPERIFIG